MSGRRNSEDGRMNDGRDAASCGRGRWLRRNQPPHYGPPSHRFEHPEEHPQMTRGVGYSGPAYSGQPGVSPQGNRFTRPTVGKR